MRDTKEAPDKQAILVMAHKDFDQLANLFRCLDFEGFDLYVHIDAKARDVPFEDLANACTRSRVEFVERMGISWGDSSQVECSLRLIGAALSGGGYSMLHLLTGQDMPLHPAEEVWRWFDEGRGRQFVGIARSEPRGDLSGDERMRWATYYLTGFGGRKRPWTTIGWNLSRLQLALGVDRARGSGLTFGKGSAYYSISGEFARWIMERKELVRGYFCDRTLCCDEVFMQTMLLSSPYAGRLWEPDGEEFAQSARLMDWSRPEGTGPHTWRMGDWDELAGAESRMFARKFDRAVDAEVIDRLTEHVLSIGSDAS